LLSLISILETETLHFSHLYDLFRYDPNEGTGGLLIDVVRSPLQPSVFISPTTPEIESQNAKEIEKIEAELRVPLSELLPSYRDKVKKWDEANKNVYISSWHANDIESDFMWRVYGKYEYGFAILSSAHDLVESLKINGIHSTKIGFGFVVYPTRDILIRDNLTEELGDCSSFMIKSPEYSTENEFRLFLRTKSQVTSCDMRVDLKKLIHRIKISPLTPSWAVKPLINTLNPICEKKGLPSIHKKPRLRNF